MDLISLAIFLIVVIAIAGILYWFLSVSGIPIPQPIKIVIWAIVAIVAILFLAHFAGVRV